MAQGPTNVELLRKAGVLPKGTRLTRTQTKAINGLSREDVETVLAVYGEVGPIELRDDSLRILIF